MPKNNKTIAVNTKAPETLVVKKVISRKGKKTLKKSQLNAFNTSSSYGQSFSERVYPATSPYQLFKSSANNSGSSDLFNWKFTDFFDSPGVTDVETPYLVQYGFKTLQNIFEGSAETGDHGTSTVTRLVLSALPNFAMDTTDGSTMIVFGVPVRSGTTDSDPTASSAAQRTTVLLPSSSPKWVNVGEWKAKDLFGRSSVMPAENADGVVTLFTVGTFGPDNTAPTGDKIQFRVECFVSTSIPSLAKIEVKLAITKADGWYKPASGSPSELMAIIRPIGITKRP